jgi:uncharacterized glyoxalase superfamily protein PhnB
VKDTERTAQFYGKLGFNTQKNTDQVKIKMGDITLAFIDENKTPIKNESGVEPKGTGIFTYMEVEDVDKFFQDTKNNGVIPRTEPKTWTWGKREFVVKDPDGYKFVFFSPVNQ